MFFPRQSCFLGLYVWSRFPVLHDSLQGLLFACIKFLGWNPEDYVFFILTPTSLDFIYRQDSLSYPCFFLCTTTFQAYLHLFSIP